MKKLFVLLLVLVMALTLAACASEDDNPMNDKVINIGVAEMTYTDEATGDVFTYEYLTSTTVTITAFRATNFEPHVVTVPAKVTVVTEKNAYGESNTMEMDVAAIGENAFYAKSGIAEIRFAEGCKLQTISAYAFAGCEVLDNLVLPATVTEIGENAFYGCTALKTVKLNDGLTTIGNAAFYKCSAIEEIAFPASLVTIGDSAFADCTALKAITIPEGAKTIGTQAFYNCTDVATVTLPASLESIGLYAFSTQLRGVEVEVPTEDGEGTTTEIVDVVFNTVEGSYAAKYIENPPTAEAEGEENEDAE